MLCFGCHLDKTNCERESGYVKLNDTESSFNNETREIFNSNQYGSFAFVDNYSDKKPKKYINNKIYSLDLNKCRRNNMIHNKEDYPVFTVLDKVEEYVETEKIKPGLYFVESANYFPLRGNRWYHNIIIKYTLQQNIIKHSDIKFQIISGLTLKHDYFNPFIQHLSNKLEDEKDLLKLAVNGMVGKFKPKQRENWSSICIDENPNTMFYHFLKTDGSFIKPEILMIKPFIMLTKNISQQKMSQKQFYIMLFLS